LNERLSVSRIPYFQVDTEICLFPGNLVASMIPERRLECKGRNPAEVSNLLRPRLESLVGKLKEPSVADKKLWDELKQTYRVLCLSVVHNHILMWSHYTNCHQGVVLGFCPIIGSDILAARPVTYSEQVPVAANLDDFIIFLTGEGPHRRTSAWLAGEHDPMGKSFGVALEVA
jgi:hypothetical protein